MWLKRWVVSSATPGRVVKREIQRVTVMVMKEKVTQFQQKHLAYARIFTLLLAGLA